MARGTLLVARRTASRTLTFDVPAGRRSYVEASAAEADKQEEKPQDCEEEVGAALEVEHPGLEFLAIGVEQRAETTALGRRRSQLAAVERGTPRRAKRWELRSWQVRSGRRWS